LCAFSYLELRCNNTQLIYNTTQKVNKKDKKNATELIYSRIKSHYALSTDAELANFLGISAQGISNSIARNSPNWNNIITKCEDVNLNWLKTGTGEVKRTNKLKTTKGIPLIPVEAMAGFAGGDVQVMDYDIQEDYIITPELENKGVKYLIRASGSSMTPKYNNGDLLACRPITDITFMQWGKVYVLDTDQGPLVKRLYPCTPEDDEYYECRSDNFERYPPFKINRASIRRIAIVVGVLRLE